MWPPRRYSAVQGAAALHASAGLMAMSDASPDALACLLLIALKKHAVDLTGDEQNDAVHQALGNLATKPLSHGQSGAF